MGKNLPVNAGVAGLISGWGTQIPHALGQLSKDHELQGRLATAKKKKKGKSNTIVFLKLAFAEHIMVHGGALGPLR